MSRITVIGTGYVGLTTGSYLAHIGHEVVCVDVIADKVAHLNRGDIPIYEVGLEELVHSGLESGNLRFVLGSADGVAGAEFVFLCLPTPQGEDGSADLSFIREEAERLGPLVDSGSIVINKSTVPVGSTRIVERALARGDVFVVSNPEFLREGSAVHDCLNPDRIVIGADDAAIASRVAALYDRIRAPVLVTDPASAELIKYASNGFLATKISYVNAIANLCEAVGADVKEVVLGMGYDKRIGFEFLRPGPGWGGSCFHPSETVIVRRGDDVRLLTFEELLAEVRECGTRGWEALCWEPGSAGPWFQPIDAFTERPFNGDLVELRTKMGRRLRVTPDHPMVVGDGAELDAASTKLAADVTSGDWLPIALGFPDLGWEDAIGTPLGSNTYDKAIPDLIWSRPDAEKRAVLRGLWDGDGSWSKITGGPSVVFEYGTVSRKLADGMLRLLSALGITARLKVGRTAKSTCDTYWICISGADQLVDCLWLFPAEERLQIIENIQSQSKRIRPTGYRAAKGTSWVRATSVQRVPYSGPVYSVEVRAAHTVVTSFGLVAHNCFPKDTRALVKIAEEAGYDFWLLDGVIDVNVEQYGRMVDKIAAACPDGSLDGRTIGVWGLTFKAMTDDLRESPALEVVGRLLGVGAKVQAYDPMVNRARAATDPRLAGLTMCDDAYAACAGADLVVVLTEWDEFRWLDFTKVRDQLAIPSIVDCRNLLDPAPLRRRGFTYVGVGRP